MPGSGSTGSGPPGSRVDVAVVGSGPNGLAAALRCAEAGRRVLVLEAEHVAGGGCRTLPMSDLLPGAGDGLTVDPCSAVHPMAAESPFFRSLVPQAAGVELLRPPVQVAHALPGRDALVLDGPLDHGTLAAGLGDPDEARRWIRLLGPLVEHLREVVDTALGDQRSVPPPVGAAALAVAGARVAAGDLGARVLGPAGRTLLAGISAHSITPPGAPAAIGVGLLLGALAHGPAGWPVPAGGSGALSVALLSRLEAAGARVHTGVRVDSLRDLEADRVVLDTSTRELGRILLASDPSPALARRARRLEGARLGGAAAKVDFVLSGPVPWRDPRVAGAGTVHLGGTTAEIDAAERTVAAGRIPGSPVVLVAQPWVADPSRVAPDGRLPLWTYAHVPTWSGEDVTETVTAQIEACAPGFRDVVVAARCTPAARMADHDLSLAGGDIASGAVDLSGLFARPVPRLDPYSTGVPGLWHASASTPPGPGVHGMAGDHAARRILAGRGGTLRA